MNEKMLVLLALQKEIKELQDKEGVVDISYRGIHLTAEKFDEWFPNFPEKEYTEIHNLKEIVIGDCPVYALFRKENNDEQ